jgi:hypothetical protein
MVRIKTVAIALAAAFALIAAPDDPLAKRNGDEHRSAYYGIVESRPVDRWEGPWVIGGRTFTADSETEFDRSEGPWNVGSCAKVHIRDGWVHEIDSEPIGDCP